MLTLFEVLLTKNTVDHLKFVSRKQVVIWLNGCPFRKCRTRAYQCTKYERIRIVSCVRDFFGFYKHLLLIVYRAISINFVGSKYKAIRQDLMILWIFFMNKVIKISYASPVQ